MHPQIHVPNPLSKIKPEDITIDDLRHLSKESFILWTQTSGAKMDNENVDFDLHRYLVPIYACDDSEIVWQKAAQLGATSYMLLRMIWWLHAHPGRKAGLYFPTKEGVENLSKDRLGPLLESIPEINYSVDTQDKLGLRKIGKSSFYLFHLGGVASKDSVPLDFVAFDEVRLCSAKEIDQALERISHSRYKQKIFMSTAGLPEADIAARFDLGTQHIWMAKCGCADGCDLARSFPACVVDDKKRGKIYLRCPKCLYVINDPQNGRYVAHNPGAAYTSFHVSQLTSKLMPLRYLWDVYGRTTNKAEFYQAKLGLPYVNEANRGVTKASLEACVDTSIEWHTPKKRERETTRTAMGVDQGGGYCYAIIADLVGTQKRIRHVEIIETDNPIYFKDGKKVSPFVRLKELMTEYNVTMAVVDAMPNFNEARDLALAFPGRVFAGWYNKEAKDVVTWGDKPKVKVTLKKAGPVMRFKYHALLSRYLSMQDALAEWTNQNVICPDPDGLVQMVMDEQTKTMQPEAVMRRFFSMFQRLVKQFHMTNEETGEGRNEWIYSGGDPHGAHAWNYCNVALERLKRVTQYAFV